MPDVAISLGMTGTSAGADLRLDSDGALGATPLIYDNLATFLADPYVVLDGQVAADSGIGVRERAAAGVEASSGFDVNYEFIFNDDAYAFWVPLPQYLAPPANGGRRWWPVQSARTDTSPRISLYTISGPTGAGVYGPDSPYIAESYSFQGRDGRIARPAMVFDKETCRASIDAEGSFESVTLAVTAVFHPSRLPYYGIFEANAATGQPLVLRWHHGQLRVYSDEMWVLAHESYRAAHAPVIMLLSLDSTTDTGRFMCLDSTRTTRTFSAVGLDYVGIFGVLGALGQGTLASPFRFGSEMDFLNIAIWDRALTFPEMEEKANKLCLAYGVAP